MRRISNSQASNWRRCSSVHDPIVATAASLVIYRCPRQAMAAESHGNDSWKSCLTSAATRSTTCTPQCRCATMASAGLAPATLTFIDSRLSASSIPCDRGGFRGAFTDSFAAEAQGGQGGQAKMTKVDWNHEYAELPGLKVHYVRHGKGLPVILQHGWPEFWYVFHKNIPELAEHFDIIVPDLRGFGDSDKPEATLGYENMLERAVDAGARGAQLRASCTVARCRPTTDSHHQLSSLSITYRYTSLPDSPGWTCVRTSVPFFEHLPSRARCRISRSWYPLLPGFGEGRVPRIRAAPPPAALRPRRRCPGSRGRDRIRRCPLHLLLRRLQFG